MKIMFPVQLSFHLAIPTVDVSSAALGVLLPNLEVGCEADLMNAATEWPEAVMLVKDWRERLPNMPWEFPTQIVFPHFPGREVGNEAVMRPTKLALLRRLSAAFECRVICSARDFHREEDGVPTYAFEETFLCRSGRIFSTALGEALVNEGYRTGDGWTPVDELPDMAVDEQGRLVDHDAAVRAVAGWISVRDQTHLRKADCTSLIHPKRPAPIPWEDRPPPTEAEIEAESAEEFPTDEELDREEWQMEEHFRRLNAWERGFGTTAGKQLLEEGISLPPPEALSDAALTEKLWQVIHGLAAKHTYLHSTNHLDDRALYTWLWREGLSDDIMSAADLPDSAVHFDLLSSGDEESKNISLIYYDSGEDRADWHATWPNDPIPAHIDPPRDRDRHLPQREED